MPLQLRILVLPLSARYVRHHRGPTRRGSRTVAEWADPAVLVSALPRRPLRHADPPQRRFPGLLVAGSRRVLLRLRPGASEGPSRTSVGVQGWGRPLRRARSRRRALPHEGSVERKGGGKERTRGSPVPGVHLIDPPRGYTHRMSIARSRHVAVGGRDIRHPNLARATFNTPNSKNNYISSFSIETHARPWPPQPTTTSRRW